MKQKTSRVEFRATENTKEKLFSQAKTNNQTISEYIRSMVDNTSVLGNRHEALISTYVLIARLQNILNEYPELPDGLIDSITQEVLNHVKIQN